MIRDVLNYALAGALAASLALHARRDAPEPPVAGDVALPAAAWETLELTSDQSHQLVAACLPVSEDAGTLEREVAACALALERSLADETCGVGEVRALAGRLGELRAREIELCVESILNVRAVLADEQVEVLLRCCSPADVGCGFTE